MGVFFSESGHCHIPAEKQADFMEKAKIVCREAGIYDGGIVSMYGSTIRVAKIPDFTKDTVIIDYSAYEMDQWETAGIEPETGIWSNKVGYKAFEGTLSALYSLAEIYSDTPYMAWALSGKSSVEWLAYLFGKDFVKDWRKDVWTLFETLSKECRKYGCEIPGDLGERYVPEKRLNEIIEFYGYGEGSMQTAACLMGIPSWKEALKALGDIEQECPELEEVTARLRSIGITEEEQLEAILKMITDRVPPEGGNKEFLDLITIIAGLCIRCDLRISTKMLSEIYHKDFWELWDRVREGDLWKGLHEGALQKYAGNDLTKFLNPVTTEEYFSLSKEYLKLHGARYEAPNEKEKRFYDPYYQKIRAMYDAASESVPAKECRRRFIKAIADIQKKYGSVLFYEDAFEDHFDSFDEPGYAKAVGLLERCAVDEYFVKADLAALFALLNNKTMRFEKLGY